MVGKTLGHYDILAPLGSGGMGEVYRARDTTLKRDVAVKVLSAEFVNDPGRLARLEREAHLLASLNHPNIAIIHSLERKGDTSFLVLELVKGQSLERQLTAGPLRVEKAVDFGKQIAEALEAAHGEGIIHRDLKPANVVITPDGRAKVLDFGIAKTVDAGATNLGTQATNLTVAGTLVGTVPYMSPEQIRGEVVDKRADVWAFGCVLFEMLSGGDPFGRKTVADTLAAIIEQEPDWGRLPVPTPDSVRSLLHRCLQKDMKLRLRDLGDAWVEMNALTTDPSGMVADSLAGMSATGAGVAVPKTRSQAPWIAAAMAGAALLGAVGMWAWLLATGVPSPSPMLRAEIGVPDDTRFRGGIALSPDGHDLVYVARSGDTRLYHHPMSELTATPIPGTEGAGDPFFSPDGEWVGFRAGSGFKKVSLSEGQVLDVCTECAGVGNGAVWLQDDTIVFAYMAALSQVPADGGEPAMLAQPAAGQATSYRYPSGLPGGQGILVEVHRVAGEEPAVGVVLFDTGELRILKEAGRTPKYSPTGHVVFSDQQTLFALPIDLQLLQASGQAQGVVEGVRPNFDVSEEGTLVYQHTSTSGNDIVQVDFDGNPTRLTDDSRLYEDVRLSPDGRFLALSGRDPGELQRIWVYDLSRRGTPEPLTFEEAAGYPTWSHDGTRVAFSMGTASLFPMYWTAPNDLNRERDQLTTTIRFAPQRPSSFSPDGTVLAFRQGKPPGERGERDPDIMLLPMQGDATLKAFVETPADEVSPRFSPDGRWLTYTSNSTGQNEVYVTPYPGPPSVNRVSQGGGQHAVWAHDGKTIFYRSDDKMMAVSFEDEPEMLIGDPEILFEGRYHGGRLRHNYDIGPEGEGFLMITPPEELWPNKINFVFNWVEGLKELVPPGR